MIAKKSSALVCRRMRSRRRRWRPITGAWVCCTSSTRRRAWKKSGARCCKAYRACAGRDKFPRNWARIGPRKKIDGDSSAKRGGAGKDAPRGAFRARDFDGAAKCGKAGNIDDGPRETCRGKNRRKTGQGGVHGIPSPKRKLREGDIVSIDFGMEVDGYYADSAVTVPVGQIQPEVRKLLNVTRESLDRAIDKMRAGNRLGDVGHAVQSWVEQNGFSV